MKKYELRGEEIYCVDLESTEERLVKSIVNELNALSIQRQNLKLQMENIKESYGEKARKAIIYEGCHKVYGKKQSDFNACLHHRGYYDS